MLQKLFPTNEGTMDRVIRVVLGVVLLALVFVGPQTVFGWIGVIPLVTGLVGSCPLYRLFGINTCSLPDKKASA
ncbi:MAG: DUF2892 domain-containing protein [Myxococcota bacterium]